MKSLLLAVAFMAAVAFGGFNVAFAGDNGGGEQEPPRCPCQDND